MITVVRSHRFRSLSRLLAALTLATLGVSACGGGDDDPPPTGVQGDFSFSISPSTISLEQGEDQVVTATLTRTGGFSGRVTATAQGIPAGVTITPLVIDSVSSSATATVTAGATAAPGAYTVVISAVATGVSAKVDTVDLTITAAPVPAFTTTVTPDSLSIEQGDSASVTVSVVRSGGFAGAISGTVSGLPSGVTASALSIAAGATSGTLTVAVDSVGAPIVSALTAEGASTPGSSSLVLTTSGEGVEDQVNTIPLTITAPPVPAIAVALTPDSLTLAPGAQGTSSLNVTRSGGFAGDVTLQLVTATVPLGVTVTLQTESAAGDTAMITVAVGAQAPPGTYPIEIDAMGSGVTNRTAVLTLVVPDLGSFSLAAQPMGASVAQGDSTTVNIVVTRVAPFVAPVTLTVSGVPAGVTATVTPNPVAGGSATLTLVAAPGAALGGTTLTVAGSGGGLSSAPLSVPLMVTVSGGGGGGNVTYTFCATETLPAFVAYQDGSGPWMRATAGAGNSYAFNIASGRGGVAVVTPGSGGSETTVQFGTAAELNLFGNQSCETAATGRSYTGSVAGTGATDFVQIVAGGAVATVNPFASMFSLQNVSNDPFDLLASSFSFNGGSNGRVIIRRDLDPTSGSVLPVLDFASTEAFNPEARPLTVSNGLGQTLNVFAQYVLKGGASGGSFFTDFAPSAATNRTWFGIPTARQAPTDLHIVGVTASVADADLDDASSRSVLSVVKELQPLAVTLPAVLVAPEFTNTEASGNLQVRGAVTVQADYNSFWSLNLSQSGTEGVDANVTMTAAYADGAGVVNLVVPNLTSLSGWNPVWGVQPGTGYAWTLVASGWAGGFGFTPGGFSDGAVSRTGTRSGSTLLQAGRGR